MIEAGGQAASAHSACGQLESQDPKSQGRRGLRVFLMPFSSADTSGEVMHRKNASVACPLTECAVGITS